jgi:hypothetical protein
MDISTIEHNQESVNEAQLNRPSLSRLVLYFILSGTVAFVTGLAAATVTFYFFDVHQLKLSLQSGVILSALNMVQYAIGGYLLGTLIGKRLSVWVATAIYVLPVLIMQLLTIAGVFGIPITEQIRTNPIAVLHIFYVVLNPIVSFYSIRWGQYSGFARPNAMLDIPWQQWIWIAPLSLFQIICVPLFLLFWLWKLSSTFQQMLVCLVLFGLFKAIKSAYSELSKNTPLTGKGIFTIAGTWTLLTVIQILIICCLAGKFSQVISEEQHKPSTSLVPAK